MEPEKGMEENMYVGIHTQKKSGCGRRNQKIRRENIRNIGKRKSIIFLADEEVAMAAAVCRFGTSHCRNQSSFSRR